MYIIDPYDRHPVFPEVDKRRLLIAWEGIIVGTDEVKALLINEPLEPGKLTWLGNHSHSYSEKFFLASGQCRLLTWSESKGHETFELAAPVMLCIEPMEEHVFGFPSASILIGFLPVKFKHENMVAATHLTFER